MKTDKVLIRAAMVNGTTRRDMLSKNRETKNKTARFFAMYYLRMNGWGLKHIVAIFPNISNHATIVNAVKKMHSDLNQNPCMKIKYELFKRAI